MTGRHPSRLAPRTSALALVARCNRKKTISTRSPWVDRSFRWDAKTQALLCFGQLRWKALKCRFTPGHREVVGGGIYLEVHTVFASKWLVEKSNWIESLGMNKSLAWFWLERTHFCSCKAWSHCHRCYWHRKHTAVQADLVRHSSLMQGRIFKHCMLVAMI